MSDFDSKRMSPNGQAAFHKALDLIRLSVAYHRLGVDPSQPDADPQDYAVCPQCGGSEVIRPLDDGPGMCRTCDVPREWLS